MPLRFLGRISYSLYLWHWPLIVFAAALYPVRSTELSTRLLILALTLLISTLSFSSIERPGRRITFAHKHPRQRKAGRPTSNLSNLAFGAVALVALFVGTLATIYLEARTPQTATVEAGPEKIRPGVKFPDLDSNSASVVAANASDPQDLPQNDPFHPKSRGQMRTGTCWLRGSRKSIEGDPLGRFQKTSNP